MSIIIRPEISDDYEAIRLVNHLAFAQDGEARLVDALRDGGYVRCSLVAEKDVNRIQRIFLQDKGAVNDVADRPIAVAVLLVPFSLASGALLVRMAK